MNTQTPTLDEAPVQQPTAETTQTPVLKTPIFLGCGNADVLNRIIAAVPEDTFEFALMNPDVLMQSTRVWYMSKLGEENRKAVQQREADEEQYKAYLPFAEEINEATENGALPKQFKAYELRGFFRDVRLPRLSLSNKYIRNLIDALSIHGLLIAIDSTVNYEKRTFQITLDDVARLTIVNQKIESLKQQQADLEVFILHSEQEATKLSAKLTDETVKTTESPKPVKKARKAPAKKKATSEDGDLQVPTDHLNDLQNDNQGTPKPDAKPRRRRSVSEQV